MPPEAQTETETDYMRGYRKAYKQAARRVMELIAEERPTYRHADIEAIWREFARLAGYDPDEPDD